MKLGVKIGLTISFFILLATGFAAGAVYVTERSDAGNVPLLVIVLVVVAALSIGVTVLILNRLIMGPVRALSEGVKLITLGDLSQNISVTSHDELGALSQSFNEMTRQLGSTHRKLEASTEVAKEGRAQLESSINGLHQGFVLVDLTNHVLLANAAAVEIVNGAGGVGTPETTSARTVKLEHLAEVLPKDLELEAKIAQTLKSRTLAKFPSLPLKGRFLNLYLSPVLKEAEAIGCVLLLEDVTEERIMERSRDEFFSIASHELRTPLTAIRGNTEMIKNYFPQLLKDPGVNEMVTDIHEAAVRLIEIVNDFLDTSRLEQNKMKLVFGVFKLETIIEKVVYEMAGLSRDKHIQLAFDQGTLGELPMVYADPSRITQVLYNLIGNALKFTKQGSVIINCLIEGSFVKVCVSDTGQGISLEGKQILFHKFQQSTSNILTRDNTRGTGLGLYISKLLIERMSGTIQLEHTEVGKGSTFSFTVPIATDAQVKAAKAAPATESAIARN